MSAEAVRQAIIGLHIRAASPTPSPSPAPDFNPDTVTPGLVGFGITFLIAAAVVLLVLDMVRRIRRVRYREEIRQKLDEEQLRALEDDISSNGGDTSSNRDDPSGDADPR